MKILNKQRLVLFAIIIIVLGTAIGSPAIAGELVPLKGRFVGVGNNFTGNFSHLGKFNGVIDDSTMPPTAVWTAANGDTVTNQTVAFDLVEQVAPGVFSYEQEIMLTGGTGRFKNATGSASVTGTINVITGAYDGYLDGVISRPSRK